MRCRQVNTTPSFEGSVVVCEHRSVLDKVASRGYFVAMRAVGLKVLKNKLSEYIRLAASGETVLVTDRDRIVAQIISPRTDDNWTISDAALAEAVRKGWVSPPVFWQGTVPPRKPVCTWKELNREIQEAREDR